METSIIILFLLSAVTPSIMDSVLLGHPMITLNCTTDYTVPKRIIHVSWLLDSKQPIVFRNRGGGMRIQNCVSIIECRGGYKFRNPICNNATLSSGNGYNIPLNERFCKVTVQYDDFDDFSNAMYPSTKMCSFSDPSIEFTVDMLGSSENFTVADPYEIKCTVSTDQVIHSDLVDFTWIGPNNETFTVNNGAIMTNNGTIIVNSRTIATTTTSVGYNHTSTLHFLYLSEEDQGLYTCHVAILNNTDSESFEVGVLIPAANVSITVLNTQTVGSELSLKCDVTTVRGITSSAEIVWMRNGTALEEMNDSRINISPTDTNDNNYTSVLHFSYLSEDDENEYTCTVTILDTSSSESVGLNSFNLPPPEVSVTALNQHVGTPLSLKCAVITVKGITSGVDIIWKVNNTEITERYDGNVTEERTSYVYYYNANTNLTVNDNNTVYQCQVIINASPLISSIDSLTLNIIVPTDPTSSSPDNDSLSIAVIATILIIVALVAFVALSIFIGLIVCQNKGCCQNKRNTKIQWSRDEDFKYMPPIDDIPYSVIGKDAPSTCESLGEIQKVVEWIKDAQMPTINEECTIQSTNQINDMQISDNDEECDSIITAPYVTNEEMLNHVCGHNTTVKKTRVDKFSVSTADSGIENELDNDSNKSLPPQTGSYISHQAVGDMHDITNDQELSILQGDSNSLSNSEVLCDDSPNSSSSQPLDNSNILSKFYNALIKQNFVSNEDDSVEIEEPAIAPFTLHSANTASSTNEGNNHNRSPVLTASQLPSSPANIGMTTTATVGSYVTGDINGSNIVVPPLSLATAVDGSNIGCCITSPGTENNSYPLLQYSFTGATTTVEEDGSYVDHYAGSNINQPMPHPTQANTAPSSHPSYKVMGSTGYIDHYAATHNHNSQASFCPTVAAAQTYADHRAPSSNDQPSSHPSYKKTGSYIDRYAALHTSQPLSDPTTNGTVALAKDGSYVDRHAAVAPEKTNDFHTSSNTNQPFLHPTYKGTVSTGSYIDRYAASSVYQVSAQPTLTGTVAPTKDQSWAHNHAASNINQLSCPIYKDTISTGSYIDHYSVSNINQSSPRPTSTSSVALVKPHVLSKTEQASSYSTYKDTVSTGSYVDRYATPSVYQLSVQHTSSDTVVLVAGDGHDIDTHTVLKANQPYSTCKNMISAGSYIDHYTASNTELLPSLPKCTDTTTTGERSDNPYVSNANQQMLCSSNSATLPTTMNGQSVVLSTNSDVTTEADGVYIDRYIASSIDNSHLVSLQSSISEENGDPCVMSNTDHPFVHSADDSTSEIGCYVDCYLASDNDNPLGNPKSFDRSSDKLSSKKEMASCNSSFIDDEDNLCPSPTTGVYVPYTTAIADVITKDTSAYSTSNNTPAPSTTNQDKRKPTDLFLPSNNGFSYGLLNEDKSTFGSSAGDDCDTPSVGEYIAYDDLESLGIRNNYMSKLGGKNFISKPAMTLNSTNNHSTANNEHTDTSMQLSTLGKATNASQAKAHNANVNSIPPTNSATICININGYVVESDV